MSLKLVCFHCSEPPQSPTLPPSDYDFDITPKTSYDSPSENTISSTRSRSAGDNVSTSQRSKLGWSFLWNHCQHASFPFPFSCLARPACLSHSLKIHPYCRQRSRALQRITIDNLNRLLCLEQLLLRIIGRNEPLFLLKMPMPISLLLQTFLQLLLPECIGLGQQPMVDCLQKAWGHTQLLLLVNWCIYLVAVMFAIALLHYTS